MRTSRIRRLFFVAMLALLAVGCTAPGGGASGDRSAAPVSSVAPVASPSTSPAPSGSGRYGDEYGDEYATPKP